MKFKILNRAALTVLAASLLGAASAYATQYSVTVIPTLNGTTGIYANALNSAGEVVGYFSTSAGNNNAFLYSNGVMTDLNTLGGSNSLADAINSLGQILLVAQTSSSGSNYDIFIYNNGSVSSIPGLQSANNVQGLNSSGQIVGETYSAYAYIYQNGTLQYIGPYNSRAAAINATGEVVGSYTNLVNNVGTNHAFLYANGALQSLFANTVNSAADGISSTGQVVGWADNSAGQQNAFLYSNGIMQGLGTLGGTYSIAQGVNSTGQVVGYSADSAGHFEAFLYSNGGMQNLNALIGTSASLYTLVNATAINDLGQIAVQGTVNATGQSTSFLLTPIPAAVPAPAALGLLGFSLLGLLLVQRRRRKGTLFSIP